MILAVLAFVMEVDRYGFAIWKVLIVLHPCFGDVAKSLNILNMLAKLHSNFEFFANKLRETIVKDENLVIMYLDKLIIETHPSMLSYLHALTNGTKFLL